MLLFIQRGALALSYYLSSPVLYSFFDWTIQQCIMYTEERWCIWALFLHTLWVELLQTEVSQIKINQRTDIEWRKYTGLVVTNVSFSPFVIFNTFSLVYFNVLFWTIFQFCASYILRMTCYVCCWFSVSLQVYVLAFHLSYCASAISPMPQGLYIKHDLWCIIGLCVTDFFAVICVPPL